MTMKLKTVGRDSVEPKLDLRGKKSRFDPDKSGPHRQGQSATCRAKARRKRVRDCTPAPSHPVALIPLTVIPLTTRSHPLNPRPTPSHPVAPSQTQSNPVKPIWRWSKITTSSPSHSPFGNQDTLASDTRWPFTIHHSLFTIHHSLAVPTTACGPLSQHLKPSPI
jgi:hypothetical protein